MRQSARLTNIIAVTCLFAAHAPRVLAQSTREQVLGALPTSATSFLLIDVPALLADGSAFAEPSRGFFAELKRLPDPFGPLVTSVLAAEPMFIGVAGREFRWPENLGFGPFEAHVLIHTRQPVRLPEGWVEGEDPRLKPVDVDGVEVFLLQVEDASPDAQREPFECYIALPDDRTVVICGNAADAAAMVEAWRGRAEIDLERFRPAFDEVLFDDPLVILRDGLPASREAGLEAGADGTLMAAVTSTTGPTYAVRYGGETAGQDIERLDGPREWAAHSEVDGVHIREWSMPHDYADYDGLLFTTPACLFGWLIAI